MTDRPEPNPTLKSVLELGPLLAFFGGYLLLRDHTVSLGGREYEGFVIVTALFVPLIAVTNWLLYRLTGAVSRMQILTLVLVVVLGGLTVFLNDERFFKMKSTFAFSAFGAILGIGLLRGQSWLEYILDSAIPISHVGWMALTRRLMVFFFLVAAANEVIWRNFSTDVFVAWDTFGQMGAMALFFISQAGLIRRHWQEDGTA
ncbi:MAG: septation protein IspZ [Rhodobacteraceae bacterium]|nr:septation protein IspZ [Paracoccaceae bacterium]